MPTSIYVHAPFCLARCGYCNFYSGEAHEGMTDFPALVALEAELRKSAFPCERVETIYIGGGTPSLLGTERIGAIVAALGRTFKLADGAEVTVEVNPASTLDFDALPQTGVNRVSIGTQSLNDQLLKLLGRPHDAKDALNAVKAAAKAGLSVSADLMYGFEGLTAAGLADNAQKLIDAGACHLSAYSLETSPACKVAAAGEEEEEAQADALAAVVKEAGFVRYEVSNFSLPGFESRHNTGYWEGWSYLGLGPGAHGYQAEIQPHGERYSNAPNLAMWREALIARELPPGETERPTDSQALLERLFLTLRRSAPFSPAALAGYPKLAEGFAMLIKAGDLTDLPDGRLKPTDAGLRRADGLATHLHRLIFP